ncbi:MAG TPA: DUF481 domain-containing protein, partial [bacterium]|nr:DUF481 domain-containing protein [bacterium]
WSLSLALGYGLADGNSNQSDFNGALDAGYLVEDISRFTLGARYAYGNEKKEGESRRDTTDNGQAWLQADVFIFDFSYAYARSQAGFDRMKDLTRRLENGVGLGYDLLQSEHGYAGVEAGAGYIDSRYDGSPDQHGVHLRLAQNGNYDLSSLLAVNETVSYQPKVSEFSHYLLDAELALKFTVAGNLYLGLILSDRYDSSPPEDKKNNDIGISAALGYSL